GPNGRHTVGVPRSLGIWKFSKNVDAARDFVKWFFEPAQYHEWIVSGDSYNHPTWRDMENHPVWDVDKKYKPIKGAAKYSHLYGWRPPPDEKPQLATNSYITPNMSPRVLRNASRPGDARLGAETEIRRAFGGGCPRRSRSAWCRRPAARTQRGHVCVLGVRRSL